MKCNQSRPGFELESPCPFPTTITITPREPPGHVIVSVGYLLLLRCYNMHISPGSHGKSCFIFWKSAPHIFRGAVRSYTKDLLWPMDGLLGCVGVTPSLIILTVKRRYVDLISSESFYQIFFLWRYKLFSFYTYLGASTLKLVEKFTYQRSNVSSSETDID